MLRSPAVERLLHEARLIRLSQELLEYHERRLQSEAAEMAAGPGFDLDLLTWAMTATRKNSTPDEWLLAETVRTTIKERP